MIADYKARLDFSTIQFYDVGDLDCAFLAYRAIAQQLDTVVICPTSLPAVSKILKGYPVKIAVAISYPSGAYFWQSKVEEISGLREMTLPFDEVYAVMAVGRYLSGYVQQAREEIDMLVQAAGGKTVKLVTELALLSDAQQRELAEIAADCGVSYLVTSTGFSQYEVPLASHTAIARLKEIAGERMGVIVAGGIESAQDVRQAFAAGADRVCVPYKFELE